MSLDRRETVRMLARFAAVAASVAVILSAIGCVPPGSPPGMIVSSPRAHVVDPSLQELARVDGQAGRRSLLVVYPASACSGSASTVLLGDDGSFLGALAPGTASLLSLPTRTRTITALSSIEVTAAVATWTFSLVVAVPPEPQGLLLSAARWSTRECGNGQYADVKAATKGELEATLAEAELTWLAPQRDHGQAWLDAHHDRVAEVLGVPRKATPDVVAQLRAKARTRVP